MWIRKKKKKGRLSEWKCSENYSNTFAKWKTKSQLPGGLGCRRRQRQPGSSLAFISRDKSFPLEAEKPVASGGAPIEAITHSHKRKKVAHKGARQPPCGVGAPPPPQYHPSIIYLTPKATAAQSAIKKKKSRNTLTLKPAFSYILPNIS